MDSLKIYNLDLAKYYFGFISSVKKQKKSSILQKIIII
jgi:hypothetical protein